MLTLFRLFIKPVVVRPYLSYVEKNWYFGSNHNHWSFLPPVVNCVSQRVLQSQGDGNAIVLACGCASMSRRTWLAVDHIFLIPNLLKDHGHGTVWAPRKRYISSQRSSGLIRLEVALHHWGCYYRYNRYLDVVNLSDSHILMDTDWIVNILATI